MSEKSNWESLSKAQKNMALNRTALGNIPTLAFWVALFVTLYRVVNDGAWGQSLIFGIVAIVLALLIYPENKLKDEIVGRSWWRTGGFVILLLVVGTGVGYFVEREEFQYAASRIQSFNSEGSEPRETLAYAPDAQADNPRGSAMTESVDPMEMALSAIEEERAHFCVQGQFRSALQSAMKEDQGGAGGIASQTVDRYERGEKDSRGDYNYEYKVTRDEAVSEIAYAIHSSACFSVLPDPNFKPIAACDNPLTDYFRNEAEGLVGAGPHYRKATITQRMYESALSGSFSQEDVESAIAGFSDADLVRVQAECRPNLKLIRFYAEAQCGQVMKRTGLIDYANADHRDSTTRIKSEWQGFDQMRNRKPTEICDSLVSSQSSNYSFVSNLNELFSIQQASSWKRVVGKHGTGSGGWRDQVVTYEATARFGNFIFEASFEPWPVSLAMIDTSTANALRAFNIARGIHLEKDGIILIPSIHIKANTTDQIWKGRPTMIAVAHPSKQPYTLQQDDRGLGRSKVVAYTVPAPDNNTWDFLRRDHALMIIIPPTQKLPPMSFPFARDGLAQAIDGFMSYMAGDARKLLDTGHFQTLIKESKKL